MFKITRGKGFHVTFKNGYTVSVQFGYGNYTEAYNNEFSSFEEEKQNMAKGVFPQSCLAETAIIAPNGDLLKYKDGEVQGYQTPEDVLETMIYAQQLKENIT
jgi:hypothetical protein